MRSIPPAAGPAGASLNTVSAAAVKAGTSLKSLTPGANQAGAALINVGRVAQDLPFGFVGIQNNLNPLLESFQRLKAETGSTSGAFKALGASLLGPAGIGLALSVVSAGILIFQNGIAGFGKKSKEAKESADELAKAIREISVVQGEAVASVQGQIVQVAALAKAVGDTNLSYNERKRALQELKEINRSYFKDLQIEDAATGKLARTITEYNSALINSAIQKQFIDEIATLAKTSVKNEEDIRKARNALGRANAELAASEKNLNANRGINARTGEVSTEAAKADERRREAIRGVTDAQKALNTLNDSNTKLIEQRLILENQLNEATSKGLKFKDLQTESTQKEDATLKSLKDELQGYQKQLEVTNKLREAGLLPTNRENDALDLQLKILRTLNAIDAREVAIKAKPKLEIDPVLAELEITKAFKEFGTRSGKGIDVLLLIKPKPTIDVAGAIIPNGIADDAFNAIIEAIRKNATDKLSELSKDIAKSIQESIAQGAINGLVSIGDTLGAAVAGIFNGEGVGQALAAGGKAILGIIGGVLQDIGKQVIIASTLVKIMRERLATLFSNPAGGIAIGIALVALGGVLKNIKFNIPGFAEGVTNFSGGLALVGERGPELVRLPSGSDVIPNSQLGGGAMQVYGVIRGEDIYLSNNRVANRRRRI
jgi:hypothetical protein